MTMIKEEWYLIFLLNLKCGKRWQNRKILVMIETSGHIPLIDFFMIISFNRFSHQLWLTWSSWFNFGKTKRPQLKKIWLLSSKDILQFIIKQVHDHWKSSSSHLICWIYVILVIDRRLFVARNTFSLSFGFDSFAQWERNEDDDISRNIWYSLHLMQTHERVKKLTNHVRRGRIYLLSLD